MCTVWPCQLDECKLQCSIAALHSHTHIKHKWYMTCTSWQHLTTRLLHNCINNSKQSTVKEAIFWQSIGFYLMSRMRVPCLENTFGLKEATPDECCSALPSTVQRNFRTPFMYIKVKDTEGMSHRVPCTICFNPRCPSRHSVPQ